VNYVVKKNLATVSAVMSGIGTAAGHLEKRLIKVKQYLNPREGGSSPMMSKWTWSKRASETESETSPEPGDCVAQPLITDNEHMS